MHDEEVHTQLMISYCKLGQSEKAIVVGERAKDCRVLDDDGYKTLSDLYKRLGMNTKYVKIENEIKLRNKRENQETKSQGLCQN